MANYITHSVMGQITEIPNRNISIDKSYLRVFSLGQDLMVLHKGAAEDTHNLKSRYFFLKLVKYIIENKLYDDEKVMAYLYGSIMHYELDRHVHPYVYYMTNDVKDKAIVGFHMASEEYLGDYVLKNKLQMSRSEFVKIAANIDLSEFNNVKQVINAVYKNTFDYMIPYVSTQALLGSFGILNLFRTFLDSIGPDEYFKFIGLFKYLDELSLDKDDLTNEKHNEWLNPITGKASNESFIELFDKSIVSSQEVMTDVDKVIYGDKPIVSLTRSFMDISYDTGCSCLVGKPFEYSYKKTISK